MKTSALIAAILVASVVPAAAQPKPKTTVEGISEFVLANKMRVLLFPDATKETFTINVTYLVGSRHEGYGETGMAHLLEHMLFKGSPKHPKVWEELQQRGASNNASTWYDRTNYYETLSVKGDNFAWAIELEADRMINSNIAQADLDKEFSVVRNEFEIGENNPEGVLSERLWSTAFLWHNYGKDTIGSKADIEKVPAVTLKRFYKKYYRPDNAVLILSGKFDPTDAMKLVEKHFGAIANPKEPLEPTYTQEPVQDGERNVTLRRSGENQVVGLVYHTTATGDADYAAVDAVADILTSEPSGRLYAALVKTGMATSVRARQLVLHDPGVLQIMAVVPANKNAEAVKTKMLQIVEGFAKSKVADDEIARFKAKSKKRFKLAFANSTSIALALSEYIGAGDWRLLFINRDQVTKLTVADATRVAGKYLIASNRTLGMFVPTKTPERAPLVATPDVAKMVEGYKGAPPEAEGEKFDATLENIEKRTARSTLANGLKLALLAKKTRGGVVRARLTMRFGAEADFSGKNAVAVSILDEVISRGTKKLTFQQLKDKWDELEAQVSFASQPGQLDVNIQTTKENLAAVLVLVDEVLRQPAYPQDQYDVAIKEVLASLEESKQDPQAQAFTTVGRIVGAYPKTHPRYVPTTEESIASYKALTLGEVKKFPPMFGMSNAQLTFVGDFDAATIKPWVDKTWGTWKSPKPFKRIERKFFPTTAGEQVLDFSDKANALIAVVHAVDMKDDDADAPAIALANYTLGGGGFVSRLVSRLRQKDGLSYFAFSQMQLYALDAAGAFIAGGAMNPENAKKGMAAMLEEIDKFTKTGITADELSGAKKGVLEGFQRNLSSDPTVLSLLHDGLFLDRTTEFWTKRNKSIEALTLAQVNDTIKRRYKPTSMVKVTAGDKKKM